MSAVRWSAAVEGFTLPWQAARVLARERSLWGWALIPFGLCALALGAATAAVVTHAGSLYGLVTGWMPSLAAERWFEWLWVGPALVLLHGVGGVLFLGVTVVVLAGALLVASVVAAPFQEILSRRAEALLTGTVVEAEATSWRESLRDGLRSAVEELRRLAFFLALQAGVAVAGLAVPGGAVVAAPAMTLLTLLFLPLDYASYVLDRRRLVTFRAKWRWVTARKPVMLGFGAAASVLSLVPGLNFLAMPLLVVAGTMLALRHPPELSPGSPAAPAESPTSP